MNDSSEHRYADIVIVGGGTSAVGLVYGLLLPYVNQLEAVDEPPKFKIALIERGGERKHEDVFGGEESRNNPKHWFSASHPFLTKNNEQSDSVVYQSVPQHGLHNRILSIPTGKRLGGGTNINATLITKPNEDDFMNWPKFWRENVDHVDIPSFHSKKKKKMSRIMAGIYAMEKVMRDNGALSTQSPLNLSSSSSSLSNQSEIISTMNNDNDNNTFLKVESNNIDISNIQLKSFTCSAKKDGRNNNKSIDNNTYHRVNAFDATIRPLLEKYPHLKTMISFYYNVQVERILIERRRQNETKSDDEFNAIGVECLFCHHERARTTRKPDYFKIIAKQKVILCAGAILSPALLLTSGIGDIDILQKEGIEPLQHSEDDDTFINQWKGVGENLRDHFIVTRAFKVPYGFWKTFDTINGIHGWAALDVMYKEEGKDTDNSCNGSKMDHHARVLFKLIDASPSSTIMPYIISSYFHRHIELPKRSVSTSLSVIIRAINQVLSTLANFIRILFMVLFSLHPVKWIFSHYTAYILVCLLNPQSKGSVSIRRKRSEDASHNRNCNNRRICISRLSDFDIVVNPDYLSNPSDIRKIEHSWRVLDQVTNDKWFPKRNNNFELLPGFFYRYLFGKQYFVRKYMSDFGLPYFHWTGTNAMEIDMRGSTCCSSISGKSSYLSNTKHQGQSNGGNETMNSQQQRYVVDKNLKVRNVKNLHVCDASIIPGTISGPTALTCLGLGYVASSFIVSHNI